MSRWTTLGNGISRQRQNFGANLTLAIGGPRESEAQGIYARAADFIEALLER